MNNIPPAEIVELNSAHIEAILQIEEQCFELGDGFGEEFVRTLFNCHDLIALGSQCDNQLCAYILARYSADQADILSIATIPSCRGKGLGKQLLNAAIIDLKTKGVAQLFFDVRPSNSSAIKLYKSFGAEQIAIRTDYYEATPTLPAEDALIYCLTLS